MGISFRFYAFPDDGSLRRIPKRIANARNEIRRWAQYDYVLVNDDIQNSFDDLLAIIAAERSRTARSSETVGRFVEGLLAEP